MPIGAGRYRRAGGRRGRRPATRAHTVAVDAAHRLRCDARSAGLPQNSHRSLRSLCSNSCGKSDHERVCPSAHAWPAPLRSSASQRRAAPGPRSHLGLDTLEMFRRECDAPVAVNWPTGCPTAGCNTTSPSRGRRPAAWAISVVTRSAGRGEARLPKDRRASRTGSSQLFERSAPQERAVSSATLAPAEHRSGVDAQHRPPQYEPASQAVCRGAPNSSTLRL